MDIQSVIVELRKERDRLSEVILNLERLQGPDAQEAGSDKRGRKYMTMAAREEVSKRMKRYWEKKRRGDRRGGQHAAAEENQPASETQRSVAA